MTSEEADQREQDRKQKAVDAARDALEAEGFDAVVVLASYNNDQKQTTKVSACAGNWYAQTQMMRYSVLKREAGAALEAADQHETPE